MWAGVEKEGHLSDRNETKLSMAHLLAYFCSYKSPKRVTVTEKIKFIKQYGKTEIKNIMKNTYAAFLQM